MNPQSAAAAYKTSSIENAPGIKIVRLLYEGAIRFLDRAVLEGFDSPGFGSFLARADQIVVELRCSLKSEFAEDLAENLTDLYLFVEGRISKAMSDRNEGSLSAVSEAKQVLETLLEGWRHVEVNSSGTGSL